MPYLTPEALRARWTILDQLTTVTNEDLADLVSEFEDLAERYRGCAFEPRTATWSVTSPSYRRELVLPHQVVTAVTAVTIDGVGLDADALAAVDLTQADAGIVTRAAGWGHRATLTYDHGLAEPPRAVRRGCAEFVRSKAIDMDRPDGPRNALSYTDPDSGIVTRDSTASWDDGRPTGLMVVDNALNSVPDRRLPGLA